MHAQDAPAPSHADEPAASHARPSDPPVQDKAVAARVKDEIVLEDSLPCGTSNPRHPAAISPSRATLDRFLACQCVLVVPGVATAAECDALRAAARAAAAKQEFENAPGRFRLPVLEYLDDDSIERELCDALLLRAVRALERDVDGLVPALFGDVIDSAVRLTRHPQVLFSMYEPALSIYRPHVDACGDGGGMEPHEDDESLTVLVALSQPTSSFEGGGTTFWAGEHAADAAARGDAPTAHLCPPAGTALIFGGGVTHAARAVTAGERCVLVASFSPDPPMHDDHENL